MSEIKIGIIGWGSLLWDPRDLKISKTKIGNHSQDIWHGGPHLPIEFARVSNDGRLTLVIDEGINTDIQSSKSQTWIAESLLSSVGDARFDLSIREGGINMLIKEWLDGPENTEKFTDLIWTNLEPKSNEPGEKWEYGDRCKYIQSNMENKKLIEYIKKTPPTVRTPIRDYVEKKFGWKQDESYIWDRMAKTIYFPKSQNP
jgi:hypothetical protein